MNIQIWIDLGCPWSYLTFRHLRQTLSEFAHGNDITVTPRPYFLDAEDRSFTDIPWMQYLIEEENYETTEAFEYRERLTTLAAAEGIRFDLDNMKVSTTSQAFRAILAARRLDWENDETTGADTLTLKLTDALFRARWEMGLDLSDPDVIVGCGQDIALPAEETVYALTDAGIADQLWSEYQMAQHMGIESTPIMLINDTFLVEGMQTKTAMNNILATAWMHGNETAKGTR